jgi:hypothetical protein
VLLVRRRQSLLANLLQLEEDPLRSLTIHRILEALPLPFDVVLVALSYKRTHLSVVHRGNEVPHQALQAQRALEDSILFLLVLPLFLGENTSSRRSAVSSLEKWGTSRSMSRGAAVLLNSSPRNPAGEERDLYEEGV